MNQLSAVIERKDKRLQPSIISNAADASTDNFVRGTAKKILWGYKKTERDQFINSLSIGLEEFNLPRIAKRNGCDNYVSGYREILFTYFML